MLRAGERIEKEGWEGWGWGGWGRGGWGTIIRISKTKLKFRYQGDMES
jgi:hypothetical protein